MRFTALVLMFNLCVLIASCARQEKVATIDEAYKDGFESVVLDYKNSTQLTVLNLRLKEAEDYISNSPTATFIVPVEKVKFVKEELTRYNRGGSRNYPVVLVNVKNTNNDSQIVNLSFHYSKCTFDYCYEATKDKVIPLWSSFRDFARNSKTVYKKR
ncbi:MAG: hypothetical protein HZA49_04680 [Planctomycetes bacterium]|nr:hypothetical protein [Planctomycetota bacterium]